MSAIAANAKNFLLNSDYPLDKVILMKSGQITVAAGATVEVLDPHGLLFTPLVIGSWSTSSTFTTSFEAGFQPFSPPGSLSLSISSNATNVRISASNNSGSSVTFYWRCYGFMPSTANDDAAFTASSADSFVINTDYNYTKLFTAGVADISATSQTVLHNLGYRPQVEVWYEFAVVPGQFEREYLGIANIGDTGYNRISVTTTSLTFSKGTYGGQSTIYHYRIYMDAAA
jgi:hypothetical protein